MKKKLLESILLLERVHRLFLEMIKCELDRLNITDINNIQALVLYNMGTKKISIGEITTKGYYLGSNFSYNLKKMLRNGYVQQTQSSLDKRSCIIKVSTKGANLVERLDTILSSYISEMRRYDLTNIEIFADNMKKLEIFLGALMIERSRLIMK